MFFWGIWCFTPKGVKGVISIYIYKLFLKEKSRSLSRRLLDYRTCEIDQRSISDSSAFAHFPTVSHGFAFEFSPVETCGFSRGLSSPLNSSFIHGTSRGASAGGDLIV